LFYFSKLKSCNIQNYFNELILTSVTVVKNYLVPVHTWAGVAQSD